MNNSFKKLTVIIPLAFVAIVSFFLILHRAWFSPDQFFALGLIITLILGRFKQFIQDWSAPITLLLSYEYLRGLVTKLNLTVHIYPMIKFDNSLFGFLPTIKLQSVLFSSNSIHWYDYAAVILYISHFIVPMIVGFVFWLTGRKYFKDYTFGLLILSYAAFATYIAFPAMPPWMASQQGIIPPLKKIMDQVFLNFPGQISLPTVYQFFGANLVAAVPSLHAAWPWLTFLFILKRFKFKGLVLIPYVLGVWFAIVYLGEHYVFDILIGVIYATSAFLLVTYHESIIKKFKSIKFNFNIPSFFSSPAVEAEPELVEDESESGFLNKKE